MAASPRKRVLSRKKIVFALLVVIVLAVFLPPKINGARFSKRLASTLSQALGREVKIGSVQFRLLPRPGFDLYDFEVLDDPSFNAEPLLLCGQVTADLRLASLWRGRLEIANLKLQNVADKTPPSLNLVHANGHWNVEPLLSRVEQVPTAPTSKKSPEQRSRFPYIEADSGRINIKIGPEKKPYTLINTDFAFWLASEDQWHVRLEGHPVRTDMNLSDTGTFKLEGDLRRASNLRDLPLKLQVSWQQIQLGQLSSLVLGYDKGWRGGLDLSLQLEGSPADLHVTAEADLQDFRRYDITQREMLRVTTRCLGRYDLNLLNFNCNTPIEGGGLHLTGGFAPQEPHDYDLSVALNRVPMASLATLARHARQGLPDDLTATGEVTAAFGFHAHGDAASDWHGSGMTSNFLLQSALVSKPIQVSAIRFHMGSPGTEDGTKNETKGASVVLPAWATRKPGEKKSRARKPEPAVRPQALTIEPFSVQLGTPGSLQAQVILNARDYSLALKGTAPLDRLLDLGKIGGFPSRVVNTTGIADIDLTVSGAWTNFAPAKLTGSAHLQNVTARVPGIQDPLLLSVADAQFTDAEMVLSHIAAQFEHSTVSFAGSVSKPLACQTEPSCALQFDLHAAALSTSDIATYLDLNQSRWTLPFFSGSSPGKFPDFRAAGTLSLGTFKIAQLPVEKFVAHVELADHALVISRISGKVGGGTAQGDWRIDWNSTPVRYSGTGVMTGIASDHLLLPPSAEALLASWISGKTNLKYSLRFTGLDGQEMLASTSGEGELLVVNGVSRALAFNAAKPMSFQSLEGKIEIDHELLKVLPSKLKAENRIYELSGTISLSDKQAKLKVSSNTSQWEVTGSLDRPISGSSQLTAQAMGAHSP